MAIKAPPYKITPDGAGDYSVTLASGAMTIVAAAGPVWSCQWTSANYIAVVKRVSVSWGVTTAFTNAQPIALGLYFARAYTTADTGGTAAVLTTNEGKHDTAYNTSLFADMRIGTTGALAAGTRTLDTQPLDVYVGWGGPTIGAAFNWDYDYGRDPGRQELMLKSGEGLVLSNMLVMGAVGVIQLYVSLTWAEIPKSDYK
jgi:hypothetical protein